MTKKEFDKLSKLATLTKRQTKLIKNLSLTYSLDYQLLLTTKLFDTIKQIKSLLK